MALSIPKIITNSSTGVIVYTSADLAWACKLFFHTRALCAKKAEVNTLSRGSSPWPVGWAKDGALFGSRLEGVFSSWIRKILFKSKTFFLEKIHVYLSGLEKKL